MNERGFTLLEVLISLVLFSVVSAGVLSSFGDHLRRNLESAVKTGAINAAEYKLDNLRRKDPSTLPSELNGDSPEYDTLTIGGRAYNLTTRYCSDATHCDSTRNRHIKVQVAYKGKEYYSVETVYTVLK